MSFIPGFSLVEPSLLNMTVIAIFILVTAVGLFLRFGQSTAAVEIILRLSVRWSGLRVKHVQDPDSTMCYFYAERGQFVKGQSTILLLPSFSIDHFMWATVVQRIPSRVHVVAVDLPGHGSTPEAAEGETIGYKNQVKHIRKFLALLGLDKQPVHVAGLSMGASTAGIFAAEYPELTSSVSIACPSMMTPKESRMVLESRARVMADGGIITVDNCPIMPQNGKELKEMFDICLYTTFICPQPILEVVAELRVRKNDFNLRTIREILSPESIVMLEENCNKIVCPSQVIWGRDDWVVHPSGAELLKTKLANCKSMDILPECGHCINMDKPAVFAQTILRFWTQYKDVSAVE